MVKIRHTGIVTKDLKKSLLFWNKYLGFKISKDVNEKGDLIDRIMSYKKVKVRTIKLKDKNGALIEILYFKNSPRIKKNIIKPYTNGITHISITIKNIFILYNFLKKKKIIFNSKPQVSEDGNVIMTYCKTPEGAFLELVEEIK
jgi:hypothetical protein